MPSLIGLDVAANYRQQIVPFSRFGTRKVAWYKVGYVDTLNSGSLDMVNFNKIIDAIQTQAEIVMIGAPVLRDNWGKFMIAVFEDTCNDGYRTDQSDEGEVGYNNDSQTLQQVVRAATGDSNAEVDRWYLHGAPGTNFEPAEGWSSDTDYQEYDTKGQFMNGYTQD
jgi:hypothetical protein